ncbi:MAG: sensor histidine kinase [Bacteroidota bacterium]
MTDTRFPVWLRHVVAWMLMVGLLTLVFYTTDETEGPSDSWLYIFLQLATGVVLFLLPPIYFTIYGLIPWFLERKRFYAFVGILTQTIILWGFLVSRLEPYTDHHWFGEPYEARGAGSAIAVIAFVTLLAIFLHLSYRWLVQLTRIKQLENEQLTRELALLKSQLSPHFFFNTLNNLYALALEQAEETPEVILKLSELMRYTIYEGKEATVPVSQEVRYLQNYLALQGIRQFEQADIRFTHEVAEDSAPIAPLLLVVLVENAFKHGLDTLPKGGYIHVHLEATARHLSFQARNNFGPKRADSGGLGLENTRRRLDLLYPDRHTFAAEADGEVFTATLQVQL